MDEGTRPTCRIKSGASAAATCSERIKASPVVTFTLGSSPNRSCELGSASTGQPRCWARVHTASRSLSVAVGSWPSSRCPHKMTPRGACRTRLASCWINCASGRAGVRTILWTEVEISGAGSSGSHSGLRKGALTCTGPGRSPRVASRIRATVPGMCRQEPGQLDANERHFL